MITYLLQPSNDIHEIHANSGYILNKERVHVKLLNCEFRRPKLIAFLTRLNKRCYQPADSNVVRMYALFHSPFSNCN